MLILLRHGQTTSNVARKLDTALPGAELTELGREQGVGAGREIMRSYDVTRVVSSEALRARQTAEVAFGGSFPDIPAVPGLQELHAGRWEMMNSLEAHEAYFAAVSGFYRRDLSSMIDGGDSLDTFLTRYRAAIEPFTEPGSNTVVVSHGGAIRAFAANAADVDPSFAEQAYLPNCTYVVLDPVGDFGSWRVEKWGDYAVP
ncbi:Alpha-ribazole phosphatase [Corynebacterium capitovis DSM 44611]|uniref:histidine phosphatase family protein n=1 Tax=Corynebacterium capitovis TaxID=131081 RepID=UPI00037DE802|nr:histidine phosphatase family protein [Corynebacterium capitovis]WKD58300.1 Alpha-ribazole phosphatase [Corynebacterium capitovis DSM 44611]